MADEDEGAPAGDPLHAADLDAPVERARRGAHDDAQEFVNGAFISETDTGGR